MMVARETAAAEAITTADRTTADRGIGFIGWCESWFGAGPGLLGDRRIFGIGRVPSQAVGSTGVVGSGVAPVGEVLLERRAGEAVVERGSVAFHTASMSPSPIPSTML
jgi:hypothetical protein